MAKQKIAIVDDEKHITKLLGIELQAEGFAIVTASDGEEGLSLVRTEKPNLVLLDVMMPKMDGFEVLKTLKADAATKDIPIILLTAMSSFNDIERGLQLGICDYEVKPFHSELLIKRVKRLVV